jgi:hypothetical protein
MYTEDDLRATFADLEREAPDEHRVLAGLERRRHRHTKRRRTFGIAAVGLVTAVVAAAALVVPSLWNNPASVDSASQNLDQYKQYLRFSFAVDDIPGFQVSYRVRGADNQTAWVYPQGDYQQALTVVVFAPGKYDPADIRLGEPVDVRGKKGFFRADAKCFCSGTAPAVGLAWEYAPGTWALVQNESPNEQARLRDKSILHRVAAAVAFDRTTPLKLPFRLGYLPKGLRPAPDAGSMNAATPGGVGGYVSLKAPNAPNGQQFGITLSSSPALGAALPIGEPTREQSLPGGGEVTVAINIGHSIVRVSQRATHTTPGVVVMPGQETSEKIAKSITPAADLNDVSTWFDAEDALPLS